MKRSVAMKGRVCSEEQKARLRALALKRGPHTAEAKAKISAASKDRRASEETRAKLREVGRRRTYSDETRTKMRASRLAFHSAHPEVAQAYGDKLRGVRKVSAERKALLRFMRCCFHRLKTKHQVMKSVEVTAILGYTRDDLKVHLEQLFRPGMSWDNYGAWEIDHKTAICVFLKRGETNPRVINALDNLQPLWKSENRRKPRKEAA